MYDIRYNPDLGTYNERGIKISVGNTCVSFFVGVIFVKKDSLQTHFFLVTADGVKIDYR